MTAASSWISPGLGVVPTHQTALLGSSTNNGLPMMGAESAVPGLYW
jgi:hypothetical protein